MSSLSIASIVRRGQAPARTRVDRSIDSGYYLRKTYKGRESNFTAAFHILYTDVADKCAIVERFERAASGLRRIILNFLPIVDSRAPLRKKFPAEMRWKNVSSERHFCGKAPQFFLSVETLLCRTLEAAALRGLSKGTPSRGWRQGCISVGVFKITFSPSIKKTFFSLSGNEALSCTYEQRHCSRRRATARAEGERGKCLH